MCSIGKCLVLPHPKKFIDLRTTERVLVNRNRVCEWVWTSAASEKRMSMRDEWTRRVMLWDELEIFWGEAEQTLSYTTDPVKEPNFSYGLCSEGKVCCYKGFGR